jgi:hypothetical protein
MTSNPYKELPDRSFWRTSVASKSYFELQDIYTKKFNISTKDRIVTAGSCFAQHIARRMALSGFNYINHEKPPPILPKERHQDFNYGVYSARYCNIYTARQLLQLFDRAYGNFKPKDDIWKLGDGVVDAFRPALEPVPFQSVEELLSSRETHFRAVRSVFQKAEVLIFTLGLTEAWLSKADGSVYPLCPGTHAGTYDPEKYAFQNFGYNEIYADMRTLITKAREVNPKLKFLLTVSPVPLVATCSGSHVLPATIYSKSVLRAVAGQIQSEFDYVDYFPSFELASSFPSRAMFFKPNMRDITNAGVDFVMSHFFSQHFVAGQAGLSQEVKVKPEQNEVDVVCEEMMMDTNA